MSGHIVAVDAGGTAVKVAIYDTHGRECAVAGRTLPALTPAPGQTERDPEAMWTAVCGAVRQAIAQAAIDPASVAVVGLTGCGNGLFLVDAAGRAVRNGVLSSDQRAAAIVARWRREGLEAGHLALGYQYLWAGKPLPLLAWFDEHEPAVVARAAHVLMCKDYLRFRMTGRFGLELTDASSGSLIDSAARTFTPAMLDLTGLHRHRALFGEVIEPLGIAGGLTPDAAAELGLRSGTPVSAGLADNLAMVTGLGITDGSLLTVIAGTWGLNQLLADAPTTDGSILACSLGSRPGEYLLIDGGATSASSFEWFVNTVLAPDRNAQDRSSLYRWCSEQVALVGDADPPVYFLPYLNGRLDVPEARGTFIGLSSWHRLPHMVRAVFEGVAMEHRVHIERLLAGRSWPQAARFAGGAARSRPWLELFAATLGLPIELAAAEELGALGAAIVAAVGVGLHADVETAVAAMTRVQSRIEPDPARIPTLERRYQAYRTLRQTLEPIWTLL